MESPNVPEALENTGLDVEDASYFLSRRSLKPSSETGLPLWQDHLFIPLARSASDVSDHFCIPSDRAMEVGAQVVI